MRVEGIVSSNPSGVLGWRPIVLVFVCLGFLYACDLAGPDFESIEGTMQLVDQRCWVVAVDGEAYEPLGPPDELKVEGLRIRFSADRRDELTSTCQIGPIIKLLSFRRLED